MTTARMFWLAVAILGFTAALQLAEMFSRGAFVTPAATVETVKLVAGALFAGAGLGGVLTLRNKGKDNKDNG